MPKVFTVVLCVATAVVAVRAQNDAQRDQNWGAATALRQEDLRFLAIELAKRHVEPLRSMTHEAYESAANQLLAEIPILEDQEFVVRMAQFVALVGDSQTRLNPAEHAFKAHYFPISFFWFSDGFRVDAARESDAKFLGARLLRVGEHPVDEVVKRLSTVVGHENELMLKRPMPLLLNNAEVLHATDVIDNRESVVYTLVLSDGKETTIRLEAVRMDERTKFVRATDLPGVEKPLYLQGNHKPYWARYLGDSGTLYLQYNAPREKKERPFAAFVNEVFQVAEAQGAKRLVIDIRNNAGTNSSLANPLMQRIQTEPRFAERGRTFVIIGRNTNSSGLMNAVQLRELCGAILVGEVVGGRANHFGEVQAFTLPNSGYTVTYTVHFWELKPEESRGIFRPEVVVEPTWEEEAVGRDLAFDACLDWKEP